MRSTFRQRLLASTFVVGAAAFASPAWAQVDSDRQENAVDVVADPTTNSDLQQGEIADDAAIVVTGSRIQRRDLTSTSPLAVVQDEEFKLSGAVNVEQVINSLPQVIPGATAFSNNPGGGVATLQLRGLGSTRTLVLVNGRRYIFFDPSQIVDLNTIPQFLIDGVDVVTGGASAVYGSDALAGVVNFRLQTDLTGLMAGTQYSITERGDGARFNAYMAIGSQFADGRGNVVAFGEYFKRRPVFQSERAFSRESFGDAVFITGGEGLVPFGSSITPQGRAFAAANVTVSGIDLNNDGDTNDPGEFPSVSLPRAGGTNFASPGAFFTAPGQPSRPFSFATDTYNYAPSNYLQVPQERFLLGGYGEFEISDAVTAFTEVSFVNNRVQNELAPTPVTGTFNVNLAANQQFLSPADFAQLQQVDANETAINAARAARGFAPFFGPSAAPGVVQLSIFRRVTETGPRNSFDERNAFRVLGGFKGPITENINYEAYGFYARTRNANVQEGNISRSAFAAGVENGTINVFGPGTLTPAAVEQITILAQNNEISTLQVASASVSGTLFNLGLGAEDIGFALGTEYRRVSAQFIPDTALSSGDVIGFNAGDPTEGGYNVKEAFAELRVPVISDRPFFHRLELNGAARYSDYSLEAVGGVFTYAAGAEFAPVRDIRFRAQYQKAIRAPNVQELFGGLSNGFPAANDPCSDRALPENRTETVRQLCIQTGVPASQVFQFNQGNNQIEAQFGGNPDLQEESSDTYTVGAVIRPSFIPRLAVTIDGFDIEIEDTISVLGGGLNNTLNLCFNVIQDINSQFCQAINRDPSTGLIGGQFIPEILNANIGKLETRGIDLQVDYTQPLGFSLIGGEESRLNFFFLGTYTDQFDVTPVADLPEEVNECAGRFGNICGEPRPKYKWSTRLSFIDGPATISGRWRHINKVRDDDETTEYAVERIDGYDLFDLSFSFEASDAMTFTTGVNNILDKKPPVLGFNSEQANTFPSTYDPLGRDFFVSVNLRF